MRDLTRAEKLNKAFELLLEALDILSSLNDSEPDKVSSLLEGARSVLSTDASPDDLAPDELGCAESVSQIIQDHVFPDFPIITGTWTLYQRLMNDDRFSSVLTPQPGDIIISPTGSLANAPFPGHTGILGEGGKIMANDSHSGEWRFYYTVDTWKDRWGSVGFPIYYFRIN